MMGNPYFFVAGIFIFGFLAPELIVAFSKTRVPVMFNVMSAIAAGLVAAAFAF